MVHSLNLLLNHFITAVGVGRGRLSLHQALRIGHKDLRFAYLYGWLDPLRRLLYGKWRLFKGRILLRWWPVTGSRA